MEMERVTGTLELEVFEIERAKPPGCTSSSTHPRCTCPVYFGTGEGETE
jgi:hypothetical protein